MFFLSYLSFGIKNHLGRTKRKDKILYTYYIGIENMTGKQAKKGQMTPKMTDPSDFLVVI